MSGLRDLDDRLVPRAAARLRTVLDAGRSRRSRLGSALQPPRRGAPPSAAGPAPDRLPPAPPDDGVLGRLDARLLPTGLSRVRRSPGLGLAVAAVVLVAGVGVAASDRGRRAAPSPAPGAGGPAVLGPEAGTSVDAYLAQSLAGAVALSRSEPGVQHEALVSLTDYRTPASVRALLGGVDVQRAVLRVPQASPGEVLSSDVTDLVADLRSLYAATARRKADDQREFLTLARSITGPAPEQRRFRQFYETAASSAGKEAAAYRTGCGCVFSVVVRATAGTLASLTALPGVRGVEVAARGVVLEQVRVRPLAPEQRTVAGPLTGTTPVGGR